MYNKHFKSIAPQVVTDKHYHGHRHAYYHVWNITMVTTYTTIVTHIIPCIAHIHITMVISYTTIVTHIIPCMAHIHITMVISYTTIVTHIIPCMAYIHITMVTTRALYRFTDLIQYVSSILLIDIQCVSMIFYILSSNRYIQPTEICDVERSFPCLNFVV